MEIFCLITKNQNLLAATKRNISITVKVYKNYQKKNLHSKVYRIITRYSINYFVSCISCCKFFLLTNDCYRQFVFEFYLTEC